MIQLYNGTTLIATKAHTTVQLHWIILIARFAVYSKADWCAKNNGQRSKRADHCNGNVVFIRLHIRNAWSPCSSLFFLPFNAELCIYSYIATDEWNKFIVHSSSQFTLSRLAISVCVHGRRVVYEIGHEENRRRKEKNANRHVSLNQLLIVETSTHTQRVAWMLVSRSSTSCPFVSFCVPSHLIVWSALHSSRHTTKSIKNVTNKFDKTWPTHGHYENSIQNDKTYASIVLAKSFFVSNFVPCILLVQFFAYGVLYRFLFRSILKLYS